MMRGLHTEEDRAKYRAYDAEGRGHRERPACPNEADPWVARVLVVNEPACWPSVVVWATAATDR